jgi:tripartite-type tricarboxylate transporter receptor subunit TctC
MSQGHGRLAAAFVTAMLTLAAAGVARAQETPEHFYAGRTLRMIVPYAQPSSFDSYARVLARHMVRFIPGKPTMVIQTLPGAGGLNALQNLENVAPRDGSVLGLVLPTSTTDPLLNPDTAKFDPTRFDWIGSVASETSTCGLWSAKATTADQLRRTDNVMGATGPAGGTAIEARALKDVLGYRFRLVMGYPGVADLRFAAEKGEIDGHCALSLTTLRNEVWDAYKSGRVKVISQGALERHPDLPDVPTVFEGVKVEADRQVLKLVFAPWTYGRPVLAPPDVPKDRLEVLRAAFTATMSDPEFLDDMRKLRLEVRPMAHERISALVKDLFDTPRDVVERTRRIIAE